jgi:CrcB protein
VATGSAVGGVLRWGIGLAFAQKFGTRFPYGTFFINVTGSLFLGWFLTVLSERWVLAGWLRAEDLKNLIAVGFTGGYTTFSSFEFESNKMLEDGDSWAALAYVVGSVALGLVAVRVGVALARWK